MLTGVVGIATLVSEAGGRIMPQVSRRAVLGRSVATFAALPALAACGQAAPATSGVGSSPGGLSGKLTIALVGGEQQHPPAILDGFKSKYPKLQIETISGAWNE